MSYKQDRQDTNMGLIIIGILIATVFMTFGLFIGIESGKDIGYRNGYRKAMMIYECGHDRSECEMLNENY